MTKLLSELKQETGWEASFDKEGEQIILNIRRHGRLAAWLSFTENHLALYIVDSDTSFTIHAYP